MRKFSFFLVIILAIIIASIHIVGSEESLVTENEQSTLPFKMKPDGFNEYFNDITIPIGMSSSGYNAGSRYEELRKAKLRNKSLQKSAFSDTLIWLERGPSNVGGRTRAIIVDPDDGNSRTWYAGTASGGIWKTSDAGQRWRDLTPDLPNLSTTTLCMAPSNHNVIYAGTGEGFYNQGGVTGDGIFYSMDRGESWTQIESTSGNLDFSFTNKIWVAPDNEECLIVATNSGIFKTENRGENWNKVYSSYYRIQDLKQNPADPNTLYAAVNSIGIIRSFDEGENWTLCGNGIGNGLRFAVAVSTVDSSIVFTAVETPENTLAVYISRNSGDSWFKHIPDDQFMNFHKAQGWYNSAIVSHPTDPNAVFVGGVYIGMIKFGGPESQSEPMVTRVDTSGTSSFMSFINFGSAYLGGGMSTGLDEAANVSEDDFVSVELRFGNGLKQKAHRFTVPEGDGPGVPSTSYTYIDYVDVPFEAWDVTNNRQLMVSFRDQERDGQFNLLIRDPDDAISGREYVFVSAYDYDENTPHPDIINPSASLGGHFEKLLYFFWPTLAEGGTWDIDSLPASKIYIEFATQGLQGITTTQLTNENSNTPLHVDHHEFVIIPATTTGQDFKIISGNDGGLGYSVNSGTDWKQLSKGFITTQFYGVAKKPGLDEYIGGMQDNGTYQSPLGLTATKKVNYIFKIGGDGFETLWHPNGRFMIGSVYNNQFFSSADEGETWTLSTDGIGDDGPFLSKLSFNRNNPDVVFTIGAKGVYKNLDFGVVDSKWVLTEIEEGLSPYGTASSALNVEVSLADSSIVWAGAGMFESPYLGVFVSTDEGEAFQPVNSYDLEQMGYMSGLETHPSDPNTAYVLFSYRGDPKILRTQDLGVSWEDISGFNEDTISSNGFPDVAVQCLLVMPHNENIIWAGTQIGIVESLDNGVSWHLLDSDFPNVSVYQMFYQDGQIVIATHGRGIWTAESNKVNISENHTFEASVFPNPASLQLNVNLPSNISGETNFLLYNINGQLVKNETHFVSVGQVISLDIEDCSSGNYVLVIQNLLNTGSCKLLIQ